jgi:hypothetical protein
MKLSPDDGEFDVGASLIRSSKSLTSLVSIDIDANMELTSLPIEKNVSLNLLHLAVLLKMTLKPTFLQQSSKIILLSNSEGYKKFIVIKIIS